MFGEACKEMHDEDGMCFLEVCLTESDSRLVRTPKPPRLPN
jgi:hypothetical protein